MKRVERIISWLVWLLSSAIILFTVENVWLEPFVRSHVHRRIPSLVPYQGSTVWMIAFGVMGISCAALLVCVIFLVKTNGLNSVWTLGAVTVVGSAIVLSVVWFRATGMEPPKPHSVTLRWNASTSLNVQGYNIYRKALPNGAEKRLNAYLVRDQTFTDQNVESGVRYRYTVRAFNGSESADCVPVEVAIR